MISIICLTIVRDTKTSNILLSIALPLALLSMMDEINILIGIFVGIIALIMIIFGYVFKDFKAILDSYQGKEIEINKIIPCSFISIG